MGIFRAQQHKNHTWMAEEALKLIMGRNRICILASGISVPKIPAHYIKVAGIITFYGQVAAVAFISCFHIFKIEAVSGQVA